jgi:hypothetical protein
MDLLGGTCKQKEQHDVYDLEVVRDFTFPPRYNSRKSWGHFLDYLTTVAKGISAMLL